MFDQKIICPVCKDTFVHLKDCEYKKGDDNYQAWEGRGDAVEVGMFCESGHEWKMIMGFHKGNTFLFNEITETSKNIKPLVISTE